MFTEKQRKIIQHAYQTVPFYMNRSREMGLDCETFEHCTDSCYKHILPVPLGNVQIFSGI